MLQCISLMKLGVQNGKRCLPSKETTPAAKRSKTVSTKGDFNRFPCTCEDFFHPGQICARGRHKSAIAKAVEQGLLFNDQSVPKPKVGSIIDFPAGLHQPKVGSICYPKATARSSQWLRIGLKCEVCNGYDKDKTFCSNIQSLKAKDIAIKLCMCST